MKPLIWMVRSCLINIYILLSGSHRAGWFDIAQARAVKLGHWTWMKIRSAFVTGFSSTDRLGTSLTPHSALFTLLCPLLCAGEHVTSSCCPAFVFLKSNGRFTKHSSSRKLFHIWCQIHSIPNCAKLWDGFSQRRYEFVAMRTMQTNASKSWFLRFTPSNGSRWLAGTHATVAVLAHRAGVFCQSKAMV